MNRGMQQPSIDQQFFSSQNENRICATIANDIQQSNPVPLGDKEQGRLIKTVKHYMQEVWDVNGPMPLPQLNREVLSIVSQDFGSYLRRQAMGGRSMGASQQIVRTESPARAEVAQQRLQIQQGVPILPRPTFENTLLMDTSNRFEQMQQERNGGGAARPPPPKFEMQLTSNAEEPSALALFEAAKKSRESEASNQKPIGGEGNAETDANPLVRFMSPPSLLNDANTNPTLELPVLTPAPRGPLPQDYIIKHDDIINYRETEYNLVVYSADRDWYNNTKENRYNFSVIFDPGNSKQGFYYNASSTRKFKNISRIELVKAIMPTEGLDTVTIVTAKSGSSYTYSTSPKFNILTFPYINVRIPELDTNTYGTDNHLDNAFASLQYDANWYTDTSNVNDGFLAMIPKFMKCQKVYQPTPLATLTKLSIEFQRPNGETLSTVPDTLSIQNIYASGTFPGSFAYNGLYSGATLASGALYYCIQTTTYFNRWLFQAGNRIQIQGLNPADIVNPPTMAANDFVQYMTQQQGLTIVAVGQNSGTSPDAPNTAGYANVLIVEAPLQDPTTGTVDVLPFGGSSTANTALATALQTTTFTGAKLINLTHQTTLVLRVITRDMDPAARMRPDNL